MTARVVLQTDGAADNVRADYSAARLLQEGRAFDLSGSELRRIGARLINTLNGEIGLTRAFVPGQSERGPAKIYRTLLRNDALVGLALMHFRRQPDLASDGVRTLLIKHKRRPAAQADRSTDLCALYFENESEVLGRDAIRKVLAAAGFYNSLI